MSKVALRFALISLLWGSVRAYLLYGPFFSRTPEQRPITSLFMHQQLWWTQSLSSRVRNKGPVCTAADFQESVHISSLLRIEVMKEAANRNIEFSEEELDNVVKSLTSLSPLNNTIDWESVRRLFSTSAHLSHKDWHRTQGITQDLYNLINGPEDAVFRQIFARVLEDGNWDGATAAAAARPSSFEPWVVLVTGVNGIRKTSSVYQPWFKSALAQALAGEFNGSDDELPDGRDSFFRQLDYIVATVANEDFRALYALGDGELARYAALKDATFARHRTVAEAVGALLVAAAQRRRLNVMIETSGRDPAMFRYVDALFPAASGYRRLAVNFAVSDIGFAERSVDDRMRRELRDGRAALARGGAPADLVRANAGGPYGAAALRGVEAEARRVWESVAGAGAGAGEGVGGSWLWARLLVTAREPPAAWTVRAVRGGPGGESLGAEHAFGPLPTGSSGA